MLIFHRAQLNSGTAKFWNHIVIFDRNISRVMNNNVRGETVIVFHYVDAIP